MRRVGDPFPMLSLCAGAGGLDLGFRGAFPGAGQSHFLRPNRWATAKGQWGSVQIEPSDRSTLLKGQHLRHPRKYLGSESLVHTSRLHPLNEYFPLDILDIRIA